MSAQNVNICLCVRTTPSVSFQAEFFPPITVTKLKNEAPARFGCSGGDTGRPQVWCSGPTQRHLRGHLKTWVGADESIFVSLMKMIYTVNAPFRHLFWLMLLVLSSKIINYIEEISALKNVVVLSSVYKTSHRFSSPRSSQSCPRMGRNLWMRRWRELCMG